MNQETINRIRQFTIDRDWDQFHTPANLAKSISIEDEIVNSKLDQNECKYPADKACGRAVKYDRLDSPLP